jgi:hypothetical protein
MSTVRRELDSVVDRMMLDLERIKKELGDEITPREQGTIGAAKHDLKYLLHAMRTRQNELDMSDDHAEYLERRKLEASDV